MTASRLRAAALYEPLTQHSPADILFFGSRSFKILSAAGLYNKNVFAWQSIEISRHFRQGAFTAGCKMQIF